MLEIRLLWNNLFSKADLFFYLHQTVEPIKDDVTIKGPGTVRAGTQKDFICTISRIKPSVTDMYWMMNKERRNGSTTSRRNKDRKTFKQQNKLSYT